MDIRQTASPAEFGKVVVNEWFQVVVATQVDEDCPGFP
jgi:hypothetical protein